MITDKTKAGKSDENNALLANNMSLVDKFFDVLNNYKKEEALLLFVEIKEKIGSNSIIYLCFWYSLSLDEDDIAIYILSIVKKITYEELEITNIHDLPNLANFNSKALQIAMNESLSNLVIKSILKQGKVCVDCEWIVQVMQKKEVELLEILLHSDVSCAFSSTELKEEFMKKTKLNNNIIFEALRKISFEKGIFFII